MAAARRIDPDRIGSIASSLCAVHCLLTGIAFGLLSVVGLGFLGSLWADVAFLAVTVTVGTWAVVHGVRKHHSWVPAAVFGLGLGCLIISHFGFGHDHKSGADSNWSTALAVAGGLSIVAFHFLNGRFAHDCSCDRS